MEGPQSPPSNLYYILPLLGGVSFYHRFCIEIPIKQFSLVAISIRVHITHSKNKCSGNPPGSPSTAHPQGNFIFCANESGRRFLIIGRGYLGLFFGSFGGSILDDFGSSWSHVEPILALGEPLGYSLKWEIKVPLCFDVICNRSFSLQV